MLLLPLIHQNLNYNIQKKIKKTCWPNIIQNPYLRRCAAGNSTRQSQMQTTKDMSSNNSPAASGRVSHSGPMTNNRNHSRLTYVKENAAPRVPSYRGHSAVQSGTDQPVMNQQSKDLRAFSRADTMDNSKRQIKMPNDPSWVSDHLRDSFFFPSFCRQRNNLLPYLHCP